jgi:hypothetical protein
VDHAARVVERLVEERDARHPGVLEHPQELAQRLAFLHRDDVGARHHHVLHARAAEPQQAQQHAAFLGGEGAGLVVRLERDLQRVAQGRRALQAEPRAQAGDPARPSRGSGRLVRRIGK